MTDKPSFVRIDGIKIKSDWETRYVVGSRKYELAKAHYAAPATSSIGPAPTRAPECEAITLTSESASMIKMPTEPELAVEVVSVADTRHTGAEERSSTPWQQRTVGEVIREADCSVRLANCITANEDFFCDWTIGRALAHRSEFAAALMRVQNLGRKSANEALDILEAFAFDPRSRKEEPIKQDEPAAVDPASAFDPAWLGTPLRRVLESRHISGRLANLLESGAFEDLTIRHFYLQADQVRARIMHSKNAGRKTVAEAFEILAAYLEALVSPDCSSSSVAAEDELPEGLTTRQWIEQQTAALSPNMVEVLRERYGLDGRNPKTLQEIAKRVHVTRERVRQVEAGAIRNLRKDDRSRLRSSVISPRRETRN